MIVSVVIPTCHRNELLGRCLECIAPDRQQIPLFNTGSDCTNSGDIVYEVIVSDDGNTSTAEQMIHVRFPWARWESGPRRGPAANRNHGAKMARGEWVIFTDDDCLPDAGFLSAYAAALKDAKGVSVFEGRTYADRPRRSLAETCPENSTGGYLWSCNFAIRKELFDIVSGFDERYPFACMEDVDFRERLVKRGEHFAFLNGASVCHPWRPCFTQKEFAQDQKSLAVYFSIHPDERSRKGAAFHLKAGLRLLVKYSLRNAIPLRGAGLWRSLNHDLFTIMLGMKLLFRKHDVRTSDGSAC